jgi:hypothetical protein
VWACPACAGKIRAKRALEVDYLAKAHLAVGGGLTMVTLTLPHTLGDSLADLLDAMGDAWSLLASGGTWQKYRHRWGVAGYIRALEFTHGEAGWHPTYTCSSSTTGP